MNDIDSISCLIHQLKKERDAYREYFLAWEENGVLCDAVGVSWEDSKANRVRVEAAEKACKELER